MMAHDALLQEARTYLGVRYVWGGQSRAGVDCSGLVLLVLQAHNLWPYGDTTAAGIAQRLGVRTDWDTVHDGDLLVYQYGAEVDHIGFRSAYRQTVEATPPAVREGPLSAGALAALVGYCCPAPLGDIVADLRAELAAEKAWGTALLHELGDYATALDAARVGSDWRAVAAVAATLRRQATGGAP